MANAIPPRRPPRKVAVEHLGIVLPETPADYDTSKNRFWIAAYFRHVARETAIESLIQQKRRRDGITTDALHFAAVLIQERASEALSLALEEGFLLFAWTGTRYFQENTDQP
ncbi:MAG: hypothetical protein PBV86_15975 [Delftia lacustris]|uniref:hypothetical protein n=1 Tax=Delftia TaxID=80865 RepID=UPI001BCAAB69|nr:MULTISPECIES: hypothetical protein [unclassified Delftia]WON86322.1 hypothetical protein OK021_16295 [Delftia sp. UGAL515B_04]